MVTPKILTFNQLPPRKVISPETKKYLVLFYDKKISKKLKPKWLKQFDYVVPVNAGEELKSIASLEKYTTLLISELKNQSRPNLCFVALGGGSVGDFVGFLASIFKRGVELVHIPSTWLAAVDSAHGGKTALNVGKVKNQIGTFYPATKVLLVKDLLFNQTQALIDSACGEFLKYCLIDKKLYLKVQASKLKGKHLLWAFLTDMIRVKYKFVNKDPYEQKNIRQILNLGHTLGHLFEVYFKIAHGEAVGQGCLFAVSLSQKLNLINKKTETQIKSFAKEKFAITPIEKYRQVPLFDFKKIVGKDKKMISNIQVQFVALKSIGVPIIKNIHLNDLYDCYKRWEPKD